MKTDKQPNSELDTTVRQWIEAFNAHEVKAIVRLYKDDAELFDSGMDHPRAGRGEIEQWFTWRFRSTPSIAYMPHEQQVQANGEIVVAWTASGAGPRFLGGRPFQVNGESHFTLHDGQIARQHGTYDHLSVLRQIIPVLKWLPEGVARAVYSLYLWRNGPR